MPWQPLTAFRDPASLLQTGHPVSFNNTAQYFPSQMGNRGVNGCRPRFGSDPLHSLERNHFARNLCKPLQARLNRDEPAVHGHDVAGVIPPRTTGGLNTLDDPGADPQRVAAVRLLDRLVRRALHARAE